MRTTKQEIEIQIQIQMQIQIQEGDDEIVYKKDGGIHGVPLGVVHSMYYAKVWWGENTPMHIMQYKKYKKCKKN